MPTDALAAPWQAYSRQESAEILHVPVSQIDAAIKRGELVAVRIGKHVRIADSALRQFASQDPASGAA